MTTFGTPRHSDWNVRQFPIAVYGPKATYENILLKLVAKMEDLKTAMVAYVPTFSYVYDHHNQANLLLNAVSVGIETADQNECLGVKPGIIAAFYDITVSIRVHTAYQYDKTDEDDNGYLLDQIDYYLSQYHDIGARYVINSIVEMNPSMEFPESKTKGGELKVFIRLAREHEQR